MRRKNQQYLTILISIIIYIGNISFSANRDIPSHYGTIAQCFSTLIEEHHLTGRKLDDGISAIAWTNYLNTLDPEHIYFKKSDISSFENFTFKLDNMLKAGDLSFAFFAYEVFLARVQERTEFVRKFIVSNIDLSSDEFYKWQRNKEPWPRDDEWDSLWKLRLKNEVIQKKIESFMNEFFKTNTIKCISNITSVVMSISSNSAVTNITEDIKKSIVKKYEQYETFLNDMDSEYVLEKFLNAVAQAFDPHSSYFSSSGMEDFDIQMKLSLYGIGALLQSEDGAAKVVRLIPGGPAARDKRDIRLMPGDKIIGVGQGDAEPVDVRHWPLRRIVELIRGPKGTKVTLLVIPATDPSGTTTKLVDIIRDEVKLEEQAVKYKVVNVSDSGGNPLKIGIINVPAFYGNASASSPEDPQFRSSTYDVREILIKLNKEGIDGIIIDMRANGGGYLPEAIQMTGLFIKNGPVVIVKGGESPRPQILYDDDPECIYTGPLIVLVSRLSASAAEIFAAALQDYGRAIVVGDLKTHGKGTVQRILSIGRRNKYGALKVTTAIYFRITGDSTQVKGVMSDIVVPSLLDRIEIGEDVLPNMIPWQRIEPVIFTKIGDLSSTIEYLRKKSIERRSQDERFSIYMQKLDRFTRIRNQETLSLNLQERIKKALEEKEIENLWLDNVDENDKNESNVFDDKQDVILYESINIMTDFIEYSKHSGKDTRINVSGKETDSGKGR